MSNLPADQETIHPIALLIRAAWYVHNFEPRTFDEEMERKKTIDEINSVLPPTPDLVYCGFDGCCLVKGHEGKHDDIPF